MTLKSGLVVNSGSLKIVPLERLGTVSYSHSMVTMAVSCIISEIKRDIGRKCDFAVPPEFDAPSGIPSEYCHNVWHGKTRMVWLPDGEKV